MLEHIFLIPILLGILCFFLPSRLGRGVLVGGGLATLAGASALWFGDQPGGGAYFQVTPEGQLVLLVVSFLFVLVTVYTLGYLRDAPIRREPIFLGCMLLCLGTMSMVALADHIIVLWVAIEATTLVSAPLILLHHSKEALEATWKYVMVCSVGIALALLGGFFTIMAMGSGNVDLSLTFHGLAGEAAAFDPSWLKAGFIFLLIGYGTKMGLAPMHTWLPDAHSEAPSPASALLSGMLLNCAFLGVFKAHLLMTAAGLAVFSGSLLVVFGLLSVLVAAVFIIQQNDYKRLLAYSSIENMGIIAFGIGIGGLAAYGAMIHLIHHALIKSSLFLSAGNILLGYGTKMIADTGRLARFQPRTAIALVGGFAGISGFPPFGIFLSELLIIFGAFQKGSYSSVAVLIFSLILIFAGASRSIIRISFSNWEGQMKIGENLPRIAPSWILLLTSIGLTVWMPEKMEQIIQAVMTAIGGSLHG
ncbi:MAG: hydrogenase [Desulfuromonadaceae bacterium]|nr:hydrogenase [Desulfuromonadaceae bacterium]